MGKQTSAYADESTLCRHPAQWWQSEVLIRSLLAHPRGGRLKVATVYEVISGKASWQRMAARTGFPQGTLKDWRLELQAIVEAEMWSAYLRYQEQQRYPLPHPYLAYYADLP